MRKSTDMNENANGNPNENSNDTAGETKKYSFEIEADRAPKKTNKKQRNALLRAGAALVAAIILVAVSKFSIISLIKGPTEADAIQDEAVGAFVKRDIYAVMGFYADQTDGISGKYAIVPMGQKFVSVHFTKRYLDSADTIESDTNKYINGDITKLDKYIVVEGTVETVSDALSAKMYTWFTNNKDTLVNKGVISGTSDNADYISDSVLTVDAVNSMSETLVLVLTGLAALFLIYMIVELVLVLLGFYKEKPAKEKPAKEKTEEADGKGPETAEEKEIETAEVKETEQKDADEISENETPDKPEDKE